MRWQCPKCQLVYETRGEPTQNPGGLGAEAGWTCTFCVTEPSQETKVAFAAQHGSPLARCWHPIYLRPYDGDRETDFTISQAKLGEAYTSDIAREWADRGEVYGYGDHNTLRLNKDADT